MVTSSINSREMCRSRSSRFSRLDGRHVGTRTPDLYRVNFEVTNLKPFPYLAFPHSIDPKTAPKWPSFDGELMACFATPGQTETLAIDADDGCASDSGPRPLHGCQCPL